MPPIKRPVPRSPTCNVARARSVSRLCHVPNTKDRRGNEPCALAVAEVVGQVTGTCHLQQIPVPLQKCQRGRGHKRKVSRGKGGRSALPEECLEVPASLATFPCVSDHVKRFKEVLREGGRRGGLMPQGSYESYMNKTVLSCGSGQPVLGSRSCRRQGHRQADSEAGFPGRDLRSRASSPTPE